MMWVPRNLKEGLPLYRVTFYAEGGGVSFASAEAHDNFLGLLGVEDEVIDVAPFSQLLDLISVG